MPHLLKEELSLNYFKLISNKNENDLKKFGQKIHHILNDFIDPALYCYSRCLRWMTSEDLIVSHEAWLLQQGLLENDTNLFMYLCLSYRNSSIHNKYALGYGDIDSLEVAIFILNFCKREVLATVNLIENEFEKVQSTIADQEIKSLPDNIINDSVTEPETQKQVLINDDSNEKLTWDCKPAVAGFIISELIRTQYIVPPITNGELSFAKLGKLCKQAFTFTNHNTTAEGWRKVLSESNTLADEKRVKFTIPDHKDLS